MEITPNIKLFSKEFNSNKYNRLCMWTEISADLETPITAYLKLIKKNENNFLLESVEGGSSRGRYSIIGLESDKIIKCKELDKNNLNKLKNEINSLKTCTFGNLPSMVSSYVGYMGYDFIRFYESLPKNNKDSINIPYAVFMRTSLVAVFDNLKNTISIVKIVNKPKNIETNNVNLVLLVLNEIIPEWKRSL